MKKSMKNSSNEIQELRRTLKRYNKSYLEKISGMKADKETMIRKIVCERLGV
jgi:hypothetical protein